MLNQRIHTVLVGKNQKELKKLKLLFRDINEITVVATASSIAQGIIQATNNLPKLLIANIELQHNSGFDLVNTLHSKNIYPEVIFIADNDAYAFDALKYRPLDFWINPINKEVIIKTLERFKTNIQKRELIRKMDIFCQQQEVDKKRTFHKKKGIIILSPDEIMYCRSELTSTRLWLKNGTSHLVRSKITETLEIINSNRFIRTHRSYAINLNYLRKIEKRTNTGLLQYLDTIVEIPISKNRIKELEGINTSPIY